MRTRKLVAHNTATASENKIHDDDVAQRFGFTGGLVPGVDVYAYLCWGPVSTWGRAWLERGTIEARFGLPTYDGEDVTVEVTEAPEGLELALRNGSGVVVSPGTAALPDAVGPFGDPARFPWAPLPDNRPPASPEALPVGHVLGSWDVSWHATLADEYLRDVREELPVYAEDRIAHPGWTLRQANRILSANVVLGPWIHVGSRVTNHGCVGDGAAVSCRGTVAASYERKGHRFVELDLMVTADGDPVASIWHTAIYEPRQVREGATG